MLLLAIRALVYGVRRYSSHFLVLAFALLISSALLSNPSIAWIKKCSSADIFVVFRMVWIVRSRYSFTGIEGEDLSRAFATTSANSDAFFFANENSLGLDSDFTSLKLAISLRAAASLVSNFLLSSLRLLIVIVFNIFACCAVNPCLNSEIKAFWVCKEFVRISIFFCSAVFVTSCFCFFLKLSISRRIEFISWILISSSALSCLTCFSNKVLGVWVINCSTKLELCSRFSLRALVKQLFINGYHLPWCLIRQ